MAGKLTRYGGSLGALRRNFASLPPPVSHTVYFVCDHPIEDGTIPAEFRSSASFESKDFPLPGGVATHFSYRLSKIPSRKTQGWAETSDVLSSPTRHKKQVSTIYHFLNRSAGKKEKSETPSDTTAVPEPGMRSVEEIIGDGVRLEAKAQVIPGILRADLLRLFPGQDVKTALTLVQRTDSDMSAWSGPMEAERDLLTAEFVALASKVVDELRSAGYWADFIDPSSGRPYLGPFTQATLFETDDAYRHFGFHVEDLGCCRVVSHPLWGRNVFVGSIFTNAPLNSPNVTSILERTNSTRPELTQQSS